MDFLDFVHILYDMFSYYFMKSTNSRRRREYLGFAL